MNGYISRKKLYVIFSIIILFIINLTIVYAALNTILNISGDTSIDENSFGIIIETFEDEEWLKNKHSYSYVGKNGMISGTGEIINYGNINNTKIEGFQFSITKPGDSAHLFFKVTNNGTVPMVYKDFIVNEIEVFGNITRDITDYILADGKTYDFFVGDVLCPGEYFIMRLYVNFLSNADFLFSNDVVLGNLGGSILFEQVDKSLCD